MAAADAATGGRDGSTAPTGDDAMLTALAQFKAGDQVKVSYEEIDGKFIAKTIVKA
jgi:hypothetical protein